MFKNLFLLVICLFLGCQKISANDFFVEEDFFSFWNNHYQFFIEGHKKKIIQDISKNFKVFLKRKEESQRKKYQSFWKKFLKNNGPDYYFKEVIGEKGIKGNCRFFDYSQLAQHFYTAFIEKNNDSIEKKEYLFFLNEVYPWLDNKIRSILISYVLAGIKDSTALLSSFEIDKDSPQSLFLNNMDFQELILLSNYSEKLKDRHLVIKEELFVYKKGEKYSLEEGQRFFEKLEEIKDKGIKQDAEDEEKIHQYHFFMTIRIHLFLLIHRYEKIKKNHLKGTFGHLEKRYNREQFLKELHFFYGPLYFGEESLKKFYHDYLRKIDTTFTCR